VLVIPWNKDFLKQKGTAVTKQMADPLSQMATSNRQQLTMVYPLWQLQTAIFVVGTARG
jgi:hypothetical protein